MKRKKEKKGEREIKRKRNINHLFSLFMHSLIASNMCPYQGFNSQPWHIGMTFQPTGLPGQGRMKFLLSTFCVLLIISLNSSLIGTTIVLTHIKSNWFAEV